MTIFQVSIKIFSIIILDIYTTTFVKFANKPEDSTTNCRTVDKKGHHVHHIYDTFSSLSHLSRRVRIRVLIVIPSLAVSIFTTFQN